MCEQDERLLQCTAYCDNSINYPSTRSSDSLPSGWLLQRSWRTSCPAQHNVKVTMMMMHMMMVMLLLLKKTTMMMIMIWLMENDDDDVDDDDQDSG